jgi:hypothetical protein
MLRNWRGRTGGRHAEPALRPDTPMSAPHSGPDPAAELSRLRREDDGPRMERAVLKNCSDFLGPPKMGFHQIEDRREV